MTVAGIPEGGDKFHILSLHKWTKLSFFLDYFSLSVWLTFPAPPPHALCACLSVFFRGGGGNKDHRSPAGGKMAHLDQLTAWLCVLREL